MKAEPSRLILRKCTENLELLLHIYPLPKLWKKTPMCVRYFASAYTEMQRNLRNGKFSCFLTNPAFILSQLKRESPDLCVLHLECSRFAPCCNNTDTVISAVKCFVLLCCCKIGASDIRLRDSKEKKFHPTLG